MTKFTPQMAGDYVVTLTVNDQMFSSDTATTTVTIKPAVSINVWVEKDPLNLGDLTIQWRILNNGPAPAYVQAYAYVLGKTPILNEPLLYVGPLKITRTVPANGEVTYTSYLKGLNNPKRLGDVTFTQYNGKIDNSYLCYDDGDHLQPVDPGTYGLNWKVGTPP